MLDSREWKQELPHLNKAQFPDWALMAFHYQYQQNAVYRAWCQALRIEPEAVTDWQSIPYLPISFFKTQQVVSGSFRVERTFRSSGTTASQSSRHAISDTAVYTWLAQLAFERIWGPLSRYTVLALLPHYLERGDSSLVCMAQHFIEASGDSRSGFFLYEYQRLRQVLAETRQEGKPTLLLGVSYALLDLAEEETLSHPHLLILETGGMKGRREELTRPELHQAIRAGFPDATIGSEYGMTELLSQAYLTESDSHFLPAPWMKVWVREIYDPLSLASQGRGGLNILDLANIDSCCFIATEDQGFVYADGRFDVLGRLDNSDIRGCNLMVL